MSCKKFLKAGLIAGGAIALLALIFGEKRH